METKFKEYNSLDGFTLDVGENKDISCDSQWVAIGH